MRTRGRLFSGWKGKKRENIATKKGNKRIKGCLLGTTNTLVPRNAVHVIEIIDTVFNHEFEAR